MLLKWFWYRNTRGALVVVGVLVLLVQVVVCV